VELKDMEVGMRVRLTRSIDDHVLGHFLEGERGTVVATRDVQYDCGTYGPISVDAIVRLDHPHEELEEWDNCLWLDSNHYDLTPADFEPFEDPNERMVKLIVAMVDDDTKLGDDLRNAVVLHQVLEEDWSERARFELLMEGSLPWKDASIEEVVEQVVYRFHFDDSESASAIMRAAVDYWEQRTAAGGRVHVG
jgi:hypothetical protein